ncbi:MAG: TrbI/VirB10 family protein [Verrucomicrobiae bacterium]|nr:TrbI/VirB10 family protein [Verrucomicrobiae bacterium]
MFTFFYFVRTYREHKAMEAEAKEGVNVLGQMSPEQTGPDPDAPITSEWVKEGELKKFNPPPEKSPSQQKQVVSKESPKKPAPLPELVHLFTKTKDEAPAPDPVKPPRTFAPMGTLIPCQLVITVDSSSLETPVVGFVTDDVWHNQNLIVPAGTEVHCFAKRGRVRNRIEVTGTWTFVWQDGREVRINGIALDRDYDPDKDSFSITDGSAGIRGTVEKSDEYLEFKMFAATALAGAAGNAKSTTKTVLGEYENNSLTNAALDGGSSVADRYAKLMLDQIEGDGLFVRVPAGTEFYIYTLQVFEPKLASVAGLKQNQRPVNSWQKPTQGSTASSPAPEHRDPLEERAALERAIRARFEAQTLQSKES